MATVAATLTQFNIVGDSLERVVDQLPVWRVTVKYQRNNTPMSGADILGGVTAALRPYLENEWRIAISSDVTIKDRHRLAPELVVETTILQIADAQAEADRLLALFGKNRSRYSLKTALIDADLAEIGTNVKLQFPRYRLTFGKNFKVLGRIDNYEDLTLGLTLWG